MSTESPNLKTDSKNEASTEQNEEVSFAETALKLGGKSEEEARRLASE